MRLKFKTQGEGHSAIPDASYRRKSQNQVVRDRARAAKRKRFSTTDNVQSEGTPEIVRVDQCVDTEELLNTPVPIIADQSSLMEYETPIKHSQCIPEVNELDCVSENVITDVQEKTDIFQDAMPTVNDTVSTDSESEQSADETVTEVDDDQDSSYRIWIRNSLQEYDEGRTNDGTHSCDNRG